MLSRKTANPNNVDIDGGFPTRNNVDEPVTTVIPPSPSPKRKREDEESSLLSVASPPKKIKSEAGSRIAIRHLQALDDSDSSDDESSSSDSDAEHEPTVTPPKKKEKKEKPVPEAEPEPAPVEEKKKEEPTPVEEPKPEPVKKKKEEESSKKNTKRPGMEIGRTWYQASSEDMLDKYDKLYTKVAHMTEAEYAIYIGSLPRCQKPTFHFSIEDLEAPFPRASDKNFKTYIPRITEKGMARNVARMAFTFAADPEIRVPIEAWAVKSSKYRLIPVNWAQLKRHAPRMLYLVDDDTGVMPITKTPRTAYQTPTCPPLQWLHTAYNVDDERTTAMNLKHPDLMALASQHAAKVASLLEDSDDEDDDEEPEPEVKKKKTKKKTSVAPSSSTDPMATMMTSLIKSLQAQAVASAQHAESLAEILQTFSE